MEGYMKIIKKIFTLSLSAILGLSFCSAPAFASKTFSHDSEIVVAKPTPVRPRPCGRLLRSPGMYFLKDGSFMLFPTKQYVKSPFDSGDFEKVGECDFCLSPRS